MSPIDRYQVRTYSGPASFLDNPDNQWLQVLDTQQRQIEMVAPERHRKLLVELAERLNAQDRLQHIGNYLLAAGDDVVECVEPAEREDTVGAPGVRVLDGGVPWPFKREAGNERYRWSYAACGTVAAHSTDAAGLRLLGRVVRRRTALGVQRLVQLVDEGGQVFASTPGVPVDVERVLQMEGSRGGERLRVLGTEQVESVSSDRQREVVEHARATMTPEQRREVFRRRWGRS